MPPPSGDNLICDLDLLASSGEANNLLQGRRGIEKESLRIRPDGAMALTPHPRALGAALTHPSITTDYSEALLELITPAERTPELAIRRLEELHHVVYASVGEEMLWNYSMPGHLSENDEDIPIAKYGTSNIGRFKHVYRVGLGLRYGRGMQCIAGVHYNYSLSDDVWNLLHAEQRSHSSIATFRSSRYFSLIRNFHRTSWLLLYLFGASPAVDRTVTRERKHALEHFDAETLFHPFATSLRMSGDLGYSNTDGQGSLGIEYNSLDGYLKGVCRALNETTRAYQLLGTRRGDEWLQINANALQLENELYSTIRPKRIPEPAERPLMALGTKGVQYVEIRCMDIDPFEPVGISTDTARFLDAYLLFCALADSPFLSVRSSKEAEDNFSLVAMEGRKPRLTLRRDGNLISLSDWADDLLSNIERTALTLDTLRGDRTHLRSLELQRLKIADPTKTPSARVLQGMADGGLGLREFGLALSSEHAGRFRAVPVDAMLGNTFEMLAFASIAEQEKLERDSVQPFDTFVKEYSAVPVFGSSRSAETGAARNRALEQCGACPSSAGKVID